MAAVGRALAVYRRQVVPQVRRELGRWRDVAAAIPDPAQRQLALAAIDEKGLNVEATAVFATLAPRATRPAATRAMVALQVAVDYLDSLGEEGSAGDTEYLDRPPRGLPLVGGCRRCQLLGRRACLDRRCRRPRD